MASPSQGTVMVLSVAERAQFSIDSDDTNGVYPGWTKQEYWNGWACPYFEKEAADAVAKALKGVYVGQNGRDFYAFTVEGDRDTFEGLDIETKEGKKHVYAIGAFGWIWNEVSDEPDEDKIAEAEERQQPFGEEELYPSGTPEEND